MSGWPGCRSRCPVGRADAVGVTSEGDSNVDSAHRIDECVEIVLYENCVGTFSWQVSLIENNSGERLRVYSGSTHILTILTYLWYSVFNLVANPVFKRISLLV